MEIVLHGLSNLVFEPAAFTVTTPTLYRLSYRGLHQLYLRNRRVNDCAIVLLNIFLDELSQNHHQCHAQNALIQNSISNR